jgi:Xaa-Pro aminopeptidase
MNKATISARIRLIRREMRRKRIGCLLLTDVSNVTYATGFLGDSSWAVVTGRQVYLITDSRYTEQAGKECPSCKIVQRSGALGKCLNSLLAKQKSVRSVAVEKSMTIGQLAALQKQVKAKLRPVDDVLGPVRSIKDAAEISLIRKAARIAADALEAALPELRSGMTESEMAGVLELEMRRLGSAPSFATSVAFGANASEPHHAPGDRRLGKNEALLIDFGARHKGYCSDITRCFVVGKPTAEYRRTYEAVLEAQKKAIRTAAPGVDMLEMHRTAREMINGHDLPAYNHGLGHGLGIEVHDVAFSPRNKGKKRKEILRTGAVITVEPGVYMPGKLGVRIEDDILITGKGRKNLTSMIPKNFDEILLGRR